MTEKLPPLGGFFVYSILKNIATYDTIEIINKSTVFQGVSRL